MHISDGILTGPILMGGFVGTALLAAATMRGMSTEEIPKISVVTSVFFVASLIHVPVGPASVHLILNGLVAVILGRRAFPAIMLGIILQAILFGHGGMTVIGVNSVMLGGGALIGYAVWQLRHYFSFARREVVFGALAGGISIFASGLVLAAALLTTGEAFWATAGLVLGAHFPIALIEAAVAGACAAFLAKVKPDALAGHRGPGVSASRNAIA